MPTIAETTPPTSENKKGYFTLPDGRSVVFTFFLVATLFMLWAILNSLIDTMDKHFQEWLHLTKANSAWVQTAHYFGYTIMALPAGFLTRKIGYKGGIIFGLLLVALGCFWFVPASLYFSKFWAFLLGVCLVAMGLTALETVANPYTTVLGPKQFSAFRINLAQTFNGFGWVAGPQLAKRFFYSASGNAEEANKTLFIPYLGIAIFVLILVILFWRADVPEIKPEDDYHTDEHGAAAAADKATNKGLSFVLMLAGVSVVVSSVYLLLTYVMELNVSIWPFLIPVAIAAIFLWMYSQNLTSHSIWAHPHFSGATMAQFFYVAAQAGIFSFFINYMTADAPPITDAIRNNSLVNWILSDGYTQTDGSWHLSDVGASSLASVAFFMFFIGRAIGSAVVRRVSAHCALGTYAVINILMCALVIMKLGWLSVAAVFGTYFFMSIMFPTIFALGIFGLGPDSKKKAAAFIVMSITGGALMPKLMGRIGDLHGMSMSFLMPLGCFVFIALYGFFWSKLSQSEGVVGLKTSGGH